MTADTKLAKKPGARAGALAGRWGFTLFTLWLGRRFGVMRGAVVVVAMAVLITAGMWVARQERSDT